MRITAKLRLDRLKFLWYRKKEDFHIVYDTPIWDIYCFFDKVYTFIGKLPVYIKLLWDDRDWDYGDTMRILVYKLERMEKVLREDPHHESSSERADKILEIIDHYNKYMDVEKYYGDYHTQEDYDLMDNDIKAYFNKKRTSEQKLIMERNYVLERYHWHKFWILLSENMEKFWC